MTTTRSQGRVTVTLSSGERAAELDERLAENPPRENLVRGLMPGLELRDSESSMPMMTGHFAVFDEWTEINSSWEGNFLERIAPSAFEKTFAENRNGIRVLFQHGKDPQIGDKPLGTIEDLRSDERGAYYEVGLFDSNYVKELIPALKAGALGASFRFKVIREDFNKRAEESAYNPRGLPERTILEAKVMEFGPVTFPAYEGATAGVRSLTDDYIAATIFGDAQRAKEFAEQYVNSFASTGQPDAPSTSTPAEATSTPERRVRHYPSQSREDFQKWLNSQSSML